MKAKGFISIKIKLVVLLSASAFLAILLSSIVIFSYTFLSTKETALKNLSQMTTLIGQNLVAPIEFDDKDAANVMLHSLSIDENIKGAYIFKGVELFTSFVKKNESRNLISETILFVYDKHDKKESIAYMDMSDIVISYPIYSSDEFIGTFTIVSDTSDIKDALSSQALMEFIVSIVVLLFIIFIAFKIQNMFTKPIIDLSLAMEEFSRTKKSNLKMEVTKAEDEFKSLFSGYNLMLETLSEKELESEQSDLSDKKSLGFISLIQNSLSPNEQEFRKYFADYFMVSNTTNLVSPHTFLIQSLRKEKDECLIITMNCSMSAEQGALETVLMKNIEHQIVSKLRNSSEEISPAAILKEFNIKIKNMLKLRNKTDIEAAGFTGSVLYVNNDTRSLKYAGATSKLLYTDSHHKLQMFEGDRRSIGYFGAVNGDPFNEYELDIKEGMRIFVSTQNSARCEEKIDDFKHEEFSLLKERLLEELTDKDFMLIGLEVK